jgi:hypothetical protein
MRLYSLLGLRGDGAKQYQCTKVYKTKTLQDANITDLNHITSFVSKCPMSHTYNTQRNRKPPQQHEPLLPAEPRLSQKIVSGLQGAALVDDVATLLRGPLLVYCLSKTERPLGTQKSIPL